MTIARGRFRRVNIFVLVRYLGKAGDWGGGRFGTARFDGRARRVVNRDEIRTKISITRARKKGNGFGPNTKVAQEDKVET